MVQKDMEKQIQVFYKKGACTENYTAYKEFV